MTDVRVASGDDVELVVRIAAAGFYDDPVMCWAMQDGDTRLASLTWIFTGLARDVVADGAVHLGAEACTSLWRGPDFDHHAGGGLPEDLGEIPMTGDELVRLAILGEAMAARHPGERHWYLNVLSTLPERQGQGLGTAVLQPILERCDMDGVPAYLESSNPRNVTLYKRHGFVQTGTPIELPDGPSLIPMWRDPR
ncbi:MAG: GNAT family N-acetyltransferase [Acidimicrobiales bacterium]